MKDDIMQIVKLSIICIISAAILALVYGVTKEPIEKSKAAETVKAVKSVIKGFNDQMTIKDTIINYNGEKFTVYNIIDNENIIGRSIITYSPNGYGGTVLLMVGTDNNFEITGIYILEHKETPGLGSKMDTKEFKDQFLGKSLNNFVFKVQKDGGDVQAITSATITSRAVSEALELGLKVLKSAYEIEEINETENENENDIKTDTLPIEQEVEHVN